MRLLLSLPFFLVSLDNIINLLLKSVDLLFKFIAGILQLLNGRLHLILLLLSHESLSHSISNGTFVQCLVCLDCHLYLVSDSDQQESSLCAVDGDLSDEFVEALRVQLLPHGADSCFPRLPSLQPLLQFVLEGDHVDSGGGRWGNVTDP